MNILRSIGAYFASFFTSVEVVIENDVEAVEAFIVNNRCVRLVEAACVTIAAARAEAVAELETEVFRAMSEIASLVAAVKAVPAVVVADVTAALVDAEALVVGVAVPVVLDPRQELTCPVD